MLKLMMTLGGASAIVGFVMLIVGILDKKVAAQRKTTCVLLAVGIALMTIAALASDLNLWPPA